jgi:hypothetical protein
VRFVLAAFVFVLTLCANTSDAAQSYQIASGATVSISEHGACRKVTNGYSAQPLFVPTNTPAEWSSFIAGAPSGIGLAACDSVTVFLIAGSSWSVPADWNSSINTVHVIGGGAGGRSSIANNTGGGGGGGGAYSAASNLTLTPGASVDYAVGAGGNAGSTAQAGGATWFNGTGLGLASVSAAGGGAPSLATGGTGGGLAAGNGTTKTSGGNGGTVTNQTNVGGAGVAVPVVPTEMARTAVPAQLCRVEQVEAVRTSEPWVAPPRTPAASAATTGSVAVQG